MYIVYWPVVYCALWSVNNSFNWNSLSFAKNPKLNYTGFDGNNMANFIDYHTCILANTLIFKLKGNKNLSVIFPIDILLMVMKSVIFVWHSTAVHQVI